MRSQGHDTPQPLLPSHLNPQNRWIEEGWVMFILLLIYSFIYIHLFIYSFIQLLIYKITYLFIPTPSSSPEATSLNYDLSKKSFIMGFTFKTLLRPSKYNCLTHKKHFNSEIKVPAVSETLGM
jgi:hypothetical protein